MAKAITRKLNAHMIAVQARGEANRSAGADVVCAAYDGIQDADWDEERKLAALEALVAIVKRAFARDAKHDYKRRMIEEHAKRLPSDIVKAIRAADKKADAARAEKHNAAPAKPTSKEKALAAQPDQDDADASAQPDEKAVVAVVKGVRKAEKAGIVPKGTTKATVKRAKATLSLAA